MMSECASAGWRGAARHTLTCFYRGVACVCVRRAEKNVEVNSDL